MLIFTHKRKRKYTLLRLFAVFAALIVIILFFQLNYKYESCVTQLGIKDANGINTLVETQCFDTQAAAIYHATNGQVDLPLNASHAEVDSALRALYDDIH